MPKEQSDGSGISKVADVFIRGAIHRMKTKWQSVDYGVSISGIASTAHSFVVPKRIWRFTSDNTKTSHDQRLFSTFSINSDAFQVDSYFVKLTQRKPRKRAAAQPRPRVKSSNRADSATVPSAIYNQHAFEMTATDPIYASTSTLDPNLIEINQPQFSGLSNLSQYTNQQFQLPDQPSLQLPSPSSQQAVLHVRTSSQVQEKSAEGDNIETSNSLSTERPLCEIQELHNCTVCDQPIRDRYLYKVLDQCYHEACLKCADCQTPFQSSCYSKQGQIYCRDHFFRRWPPKCSRCSESIAEKDIVRKANGHVYHLDCFKCIICEKGLNTGDQFYLIPSDGRLVCRNDYENSGKESEMDCGNKRPRTTISAKSLETLKQAYQASSKPARHVREQLAAETGLEVRVVQVWFQNRRAKEKRLKKDAGRNRWPTSALFNRTIDSDSGSNDESLTGRSPIYGTATYMENSSDMEVAYGEYFNSAWTPLSRFSSEEHNYINGAESVMNAAGILGLPPAPQMHPIDHTIYSDIGSVTNPMHIPHSMATSMITGCGITQSPLIIPPYGMNVPSHTLPMIPLGINDLPPYSH